MSQQLRRRDELLMQFILSGHLPPSREMKKTPVRCSGIEGTAAKQIARGINESRKKNRRCKIDGQNHQCLKFGCGIACQRGEKRGAERKKPCQNDRSLFWDDEMQSGCCGIWYIKITSPFNMPLCRLLRILCWPSERNWKPKGWQ